MDGTKESTAQNKRFMMKKPKSIRGPHSALRRKQPTGATKKRVQVVEPIVSTHTNTNNTTTDARKMAEVEKKLGHLMVHKERLKEKADRLTGDLSKARVELNYTQQERGRMQQFWRIAENGLEVEKERTRDVERSMWEMKTKQAEEVKRLQQKVRSLIFNAKIHRTQETQSDAISPAGPLASVECQTMEELTKEKASDILRQNDDLLVAFIAELEKEKLEAQSDLKYAIVHLEQRMKEEQEMAIQEMKDEREVEIEEIGLKHLEQVRTLESTHMEQENMLQGKVDFLQQEVSTLRDLRDSLSVDLVDAREKLADQATLLGQQQASIDEMSKEIARLQDYKRNFQRDMRNVENMRKEVEKYKDLNEIIMGEFGKIEKERDALLEEVEKNLGRLEVSNKDAFDKIEQRGRKY